MANQIERLYGDSGVHGLAVSPGAIRSGAQRYDSPEDLAKSMANVKHILKNIWRGREQSIWRIVRRVIRRSKTTKILAGMLAGMHPSLLMRRQRRRYGKLAVRWWV